MTLEKLIALGVSHCIMVGWCGSLHSSLHIGDVVLPTWAVSEEGTSPHYPVIEPVPHSSSPLRQSLHEHLDSKGIVATEGPIWTTDALYRETHEKISRYKDQALLAVDMEFSALATVSLYRGIEMAAVLVVSDELFHPEWHPGFYKKTFKKRSRFLFGAVASFVQSLPDNLTLKEKSNS